MDKNAKKQRFMPHFTAAMFLKPQISVRTEGIQMEENVRQDRRVRRTKRAIRNAFAELLSEKRYEEITVTDITVRADINRKTFYNYYAGVYEVVAGIEDSIIASLDDALENVDLNTAIRNPHIIFERIAEIIHSDLDFYGHLLRMKGNDGLIVKMAELLKARLRGVLSKKTDISGGKLEVLLDFQVYGMMGAYRNWFVSGTDRSIEDMSIETMSEEVGILIFQGFAGFLAGHDPAAGLEPAAGHDPA